MPYQFSPPIPTVFIVSGSINIARNTTAANGVFIANGNFNDISSVGSTDSQLTVNGSVVAALVGGSNLTFGRTYKDVAKSAAEIITFEPKYLYLLTDYIGSPDDKYKEVNP